MGDVSGDRRRNFFAEGTRLDLTMRFLVLPIVVLVVVTRVKVRAGIVMAMAAHGHAYLVVFPAKQVRGGQPRGPRT